MRNTSTIALTVLGLSAALTGSAVGQERPFELVLDALSASQCEVVNAANVELVILKTTGQLVIVSGGDVILEDTYVDDEFNVYYLNEAAGYIDFQDDADGLRTLWWLSLAGHVVNVDEFTGQPTSTQQYADEYSSVPCDGCDYWDDQTVCSSTSVTDGQPVTINFCGGCGPITVGMTFAGLLLTGIVRRRSW